MSRIHRLALATAFGLASLPALGATVSTAWVELQSNSQDDCIDLGQRAVQAAGFQATISQDRQTIFGWRGEEALTVRCIGGNRIAVVFAWVNDQSNDSAQLVEAVTRAYRNPSRPGGNLTGGGGGNLPGGGGGSFTGGGNLGGGNPGGGNFGGGGGNLTGGGGNFGGGGGVVKR